jgi:hypothetical protein
MLGFGHKIGYYPIILFSLMPPAVLDITAKILERVAEERKIHPSYHADASYEQFLDYRSDGSTRVEINGSRHYRTPYGPLGSVTTILSATGGNKAALERWAAKNPGGREAAAARGTRVHKLMEDYLTDVDRNPVIDDPEIAAFWQGMPEKLNNFERVIWAENPVGGNFNWTIGGDGVSRVWHPGVVEGKIHGWAGAPDIVAEWKGKTVLGDLKTSNGLYFGKWPGPDTPKSEYGMRRAGFMKYAKCCKQMAAYAMALEHTCGIKPDILMILVATRERPQVFAIQGATIEKWKTKWLEDVDKYYNEYLPSLNVPEIEMEVVDGDQAQDSAA